MKKIALFGHEENSITAKDIEKLIEAGSERFEFYIYQPLMAVLPPHFAKKNQLFCNGKEIESDVDFLFSFGGDGTFLRAARLLEGAQIPLLGFNTGRLGFLSNTPHQYLENVLEAIFNNNYSIENRSLLKVSSNLSFPFKYACALNDFTVQKFDIGSMITIDTFLDDVFLNSYWADGLIISTTTGSTAYSLSCGGPIMMPDSDTFVITPIAPHNLNVRPVVVPANKKIRVNVISRSNRYIGTLDTESATFSNNCEFEIQKAEVGVKLLNLNEQDFLSGLRNKLHWGLDRRNF